MTSQNYGANAGVSDARFINTYIVFWGDERKRLSLVGTVDGAARDPNSGVLGLIRPGMMFGQVTATGKLMPYDPTASDGTEVFKGIIGEELNMLDYRDGSNEDKTNTNIYVSAPVRASDLLIGGEPLIGHPEEAAARAALANNFILDDLLTI